MKSTCKGYFGARKSLTCPLNKETIVYTIADVANNTKPNSARPIEIIIKFVETYLVEENKSSATYKKKDENIRNIRPGIP
jgi:hypothetical protein